MHRDITPVVYLMASRRNGTLYIGVTSDLARRIWQHREATSPGFTARYGVALLVWFEAHADMTAAIRRETQIKKWNHTWKLRLIEENNPDWRDLAADFGFEPLARAGFPPSRE